MVGGLIADPGEKHGPRRNVERRTKWKARKALDLDPPIREAPPEGGNRDRLPPASGSM